MQNALAGTQVIRLHFIAPATAHMKRVIYSYVCSEFQEEELVARGAGGVRRTRSRRVSRMTK